jgi:hypothetical protein
MPPIPLSSTDTMSAVAGTNNIVSYSFVGDNIVANLDGFKVLPQGLIASSVGTIWPTLAGASLVYLLLSNTSGIPVTTIKLYLNGTAPTNQIGPTFTLPANGGAFISASSMQVVDSNGAVVSSSALTSAKNYAARTFARLTWR